MINSPEIYRWDFNYIVIRKFKLILGQKIPVASRKDEDFACIFFKRCVKFEIS